MKYLFMSSIMALLLGARCGKPCKEAQYQFYMQEIFYPEKDSILVGDTLFLTSSHSTTFKDTLSNNLINFNDANPGANLRILRFPDNSTTVVGGINEFTILTLHGMPGGNDNIPEENKGFYFEEKDNNYLLNLAFIPKQKGIYAISLGNSMGTIQRKQSCFKANIEIDNANTNNHLYFYQNFFPGSPISDYTRTHIYCFKVY
jgi:hypothetical protein